MHRKNVKLNYKKGILFWVTGLSGSGKTSISKKIFPMINKKFGPTILLSGDELRNIFNLKKYDAKSRLSYGISFSKFAKHITDQKINLIINVIGMFDEVRKNNKNNIENYIEVFIEADLKKILKKGKKKIYKTNKINIVGRGIKPQFPKKPNVKIKNDFKKNINELAFELFNKISKIIL